MDVERFTLDYRVGVWPSVIIECKNCGHKLIIPVMLNVTLEHVIKAIKKSGECGNCVRNELDKGWVET